MLFSVRVFWSIFFVILSVTESHILSSNQLHEYKHEIDIAILNREFHHAVDLANSMSSDEQSHHHLSEVIRDYIAERKI